MGLYLISTSHLLRKHILSKLIKVGGSAMFVLGYGLSWEILLTLRIKKSDLNRINVLKITYFPQSSRESNNLHFI